MKNHLLSVPLLFILSFAFQPFASANELYPVSLTQRVDHSTLIAEGKVIAQTSFAEPGTGNIYTSNRVVVYRTFKGTLVGEEIEIITHGGRLGYRMDVYSSYLSLSTGQAGIFFCMPSTIKNSTSRGTSYMVYSSMQGFIAYDTRQQRAADPFTRYTTIDDAAAAIKQLTKTETRVRESAELFNHKETTLLGTLVTPTITGFSPASIPAGTDAILTITGTGFGATQGTGVVEFRNGNNGGASWVQPLATDYVSWTDTEIQVMVPSVSTTGTPAGSGQIRVTNSDPAMDTSAGTLIIPYAYSNISYNSASRIPTHANENSLGGYTFQMETGFAGTGANAAFVRAMNTWTCNTGMNWRVGATTATNAAAGDGINIVRFDIGSELGAGILGVCVSRYTGCAEDIWWVSEIDVTFDGARPWEFGPGLPIASAVDFESVALHELGHGQQLTHIISSGAVMHYAISAGQVSRTLGAGDITGGNDVTARGFVANGCVSPMTPGEVYTLAGTAGGTQVCISGTVSALGTGYSDASCNDIAYILPTGVSPVSGTINVCAKYESGVPTINSQPYCERHYDIEPATNAATATATITLYYTQAEFDAYNAANGVYPDLPTGSGDAAGIANLRITQFHGTSGTGIPGSYSGSAEYINPADGSIIWNSGGNRWEISFAVTGFSGFFVHTGSFALPLRLLQFSGTQSGKGNLLQWTTAAEEGTAFFDIQRSADGINFTTVGQVAASGTTTGNKNYRYTDNVGNTGQTVFYYRLKMIDHNGRYTYSTIVKLEHVYPELLVKVLQNPFRRQLQADITSPQVQEGVITLTDMNGRLVMQQKVVLPKGNTIIDIPGVQRPGAGTYVLTLVTTTEKRMIKVIKEQ
ncbi:T9SS type A sorting domain-containing protein [Pseudoflavitalea sp. X16]|uniref:T9SS type A sorting domain-containing protein n=1 Tax=Paraflavitalea devenefica TaxID=2716334 RepID=UPI00141DDCFD|nr:T9SS type A sorting domain-containing protein [Paraflavitalea devenefica]NII27321.1 T9SS type A sorting domain-containing protein [Paraflavitalea devenefica]